MKIELPKKVTMILNNLKLHGYEAYAVGGCVRDSILARKPEDWDITTSARPEAVSYTHLDQAGRGIDRRTVYGVQ